MWGGFEKKMTVRKIDPMLAESIEDLDNLDFDPEYFASEKYDGVRAIMIDGLIYSRTGHLFKPEVARRFGKIAQAAYPENIVLDGELYFPGDNFGNIMSVLSDSAKVMEEKGLKFYCFDSVPRDEWDQKVCAVPFWSRCEKYKQFLNRHDPDHVLSVPVEQHKIYNRQQVQDLFDEVAARNGEGLMLRSRNGGYCHYRSKDILKYKRWLTAEARILKVHQQACPLKYAEEVKVIDGKECGFKKTTGSVTVKILPNQSISGVQNVGFVGGSVELRKNMWRNRANMPGRIVEFSYLSGAGVGRMGRIMRLRTDLE